MFDDHMPGGGQVPNNLPIGEPEDIFANDNDLPISDPSATPVSSTNKPLESDLSSQSPEPTGFQSALDAGALKPSSSSRELVPEISGTASGTGSFVTPPNVISGGSKITADASKGMPDGKPDLGIDNYSPVPHVPKMSSVDNVPPPLPKSDYKIKEPMFGHTGILIGSFIILIIILGGGTWWLYTNFIQGPQQELFQTSPSVTENNLNVLNDSLSGSNTDASSSNIIDGGDVGGIQLGSDVAADISDDSILFGQPIDTDGDGLDDIREKELNTLVNNWDTDGDDLGDYEEVVIWETDPLNPDTDGDSYLDGQEVKNGYNPNGGGKFIGVPSEVPDDITSSPTNTIEVQVDAS